MTIRISVLSAVAALAAIHPAVADEPKPVAVGEEAPDFTVTGIDGKEFKLSDRIGQKERNVVLLFSRAHW